MTSVGTGMGLRPVTEGLVWWDEYSVCAPRVDDCRPSEVPQG